MTIASRADLLAPAKRRYGTDTLPVSGRPVRYQSLSEAEYSEFEMEKLEQNDDGRFVSRAEPLRLTRARLAIACLVDADGLALFTPADAEGLSIALDLADSLFLFERLQAHCGLFGPDRLIELRDAAKKNFTITRDGDLLTSSRAN